MASWSSTEQPMQQLRAEILPLMYKFCYTAQRLLSSAASNYDTQRLYEGLSLTAVVALVALFLSWSSLDLGTSFTGWMILATVCLDSAMMFASSYVEEEHQFWLWMTAAWLSVSILRSSPNLGAILTASRPLLLVPALRAWNTSGQKQSGEASIVSAFLPAYPLVLWALVTLTLIDLLSQLRSKTLQRSGVPAAISYGIATLAAGQIFCFKVVFTLHDSPELFGPALLPLSEQFASCFSDLTAMARVAFLLPTSLLLYVILTRFKGDRKSTMPLSSLGPPILAILLIQTRLTNIPLFLVFSLLKRALPSSIPQTVPSITLTTILLSHASFYALGNTNSISSIDLSNAYNGVSSFNVVAVGFLLLLSTFAGPFYWSLAGLEMLGDLEKPGQVQGTATLEGNGALAVRYLEYLKLKTLFMTGSAVAVMAACTLLREHLFVWTVFSPKFLFLVAWFVGWHVLWGGVVEGMIVWSGGV
ncbi:MAG: major facilitator super transporter protein [Chrysothrix sp. TS-e1954]|nr:MAG: major facilitator super transporter protein [Chrysothrix sp. TS-e1954]